MKSEMLICVVFTLIVSGFANETYETPKVYEESKPYEVEPYAPDSYETHKPIDFLPKIVSGIGGAVGKAKLGIGSVLVAKKGLILAPVVLGAKAAVFSGPMAVGAILGAPVGAVVGAKVGAVKGALIAKGLVASKLALAKAAIVGKAALATKAVVAAKGAAKAIVMKPIALAVGATAAAASAKAALVSKGMTIIHDKVENVHQGFANVGTQFKNTVSTLSNSVNLLQQLLPLLPLLKQNNNAGNEDYNVEYKKPDYNVEYKKPSTLEASYTLNNHLTGYQYGKANFVAARRKRSPQRSQTQSPQAQAQRVTQLLALVKAQKQEACVQKVVCELSVDPNVHGQEGVRFGFALLQFSFSNLPGTERYKKAAALGGKYKDARVCKTDKCKIPSPQLIRLGLTLLGV